MWRRQSCVIENLFPRHINREGDPCLYWAACRRKISEGSTLLLQNNPACLLDSILCYNYAQVVMSVAWQTDTHLVHKSHASMLYFTGLLSNLKDGYVLKIMRGRHQASLALTLLAKSDQRYALNHFSMQLITRRNKKFFTSWDADLSQVENDGSIFVSCDISFAEQMARGLNYCHTILVEYALPFLRAKTAVPMQNSMSDASLHGVSASIYRQHENLLLRHPVYWML